MVKLKELNPQHALEINEFWERDWSQYSLPGRDACVVDSVVVNEADVAIAYGQVRLFPELMLFTDMKASSRDRVTALKLLMSEAFRGIDRMNLPEAYCLIKDMRFAKMIAKKYGFQLIDNPGVLLVRSMR